MKRHSYQTRLTWTGNQGVGTQAYNAYRRDHVLTAPGKAEIAGSSDPDFRGDASRYNPEELLLASLSACHMLAYLHLCAVNGVVVVAYEDAAAGTMQETADGGGAFSEARLHPRVTITPASDPTRAQALHHQAHQLCFIASSVNFPVEAVPEILVSD